jgi:hypothetical protein
MKKALLFLSISLLFTHNLYAEGEVSIAVAPVVAPSIPSGEVIKIRGKVLFENNEVKLGDKIEKVGTIVTSDKSFIQIKIDKWKNNISIGPNSTMILNFSDDKKYTLDKGICRWKSFAPSEAKGKIFTRNSSLGVRGTDFILKFNHAMAETEVVMFDGEVHLENVNDKENFADIKKGQWGGIGGRFGQKINPPIDLPAEVVSSMDKIIE